MSEFNNCIGYMKTVQRAIAHEFTSKFQAGQLEEGSLEFRAYMEIYGKAAFLRALLQIMADDDLESFFEVLDDDTPKPTE